MTQANLFNEKVKQKHRKQAQFHKASYIVDAAARHLTSIIEEQIQLGIHFESALMHGSGSVLLEAHLQKLPNMKQLVTSDTALDSTILCHESLLPFKANSFDLAVSNCTLHWVNALPQALQHYNAILAKEGVFLCAFIGGKSLHELRDVTAQSTVKNHYPHVSPMIDVKDAGRLVQQAGFENVVADSHLLTVLFPTAKQFFQELRDMGEQTALTQRHNGLMTAQRLESYVQAYHELYEDEGNISASFELITVMGRKN